MTGFRLRSVAASTACLWAAALAISACEDDTAAITVAVRAQISLSAPRLEFGSVPLGSTRTSQVLVTNEGSVPVRLEQVRPGPAFDGTAYRIDFEVQVIQPRRNAVIDVTFEPPEARIYQAQVFIETSEADAQVLTLSGRGAASGLRVRPAQVDSPRSPADPPGATDLEEPPDRIGACPSWPKPPVGWRPASVGPIRMTTTSMDLVGPD